MENIQDFISEVKYLYKRDWEYFTQCNKIKQVKRVQKNAENNAEYNRDRHIFFVVQNGNSYGPG